MCDRNYVDDDRLNNLCNRNYDDDDRLNSFFYHNYDDDDRLNNFCDHNYDDDDRLNNLCDHNHDDDDRLNNFLMMAFQRKIPPWWEYVIYTTFQIANTLQSLKSIQTVFATFVVKKLYTKRLQII